MKELRCTVSLECAHALNKDPLSGVLLLKTVITLPVQMTKSKAVSGIRARAKNQVNPVLVLV
ncbi:uncharacterized protein LOC111102057 isoform X2 [Crassostrea virginica]